MRMRVLAPFPRHRGRRLPVLVLVGALVAALCACTSDRRLEPAADAVRVEKGLTFWSDGDVTLKLDACLPPTSEEPAPAMVVVHGGGFTSGDRESGGSRGLCTLAATTGAAGFSIDYRLAPDYRYPAQVDDLGHAIEWLRRPEQLTRFGIDPARIGVIGSSAGAVIAQSLATRGTGALDTGERVGAVISLSGVSVLTPEGLTLGEPGAEARALVLSYLGCTSPASCPQATVASPVTAVDASDPPMLLVNGSRELVPSEQAEAMDQALRSAGVSDELLIVDSDRHGTALLDSDVRQAVLDFLEQHL
jgi:acetyl esterase